MWCQQHSPCDAAQIAETARKYSAEFLILPESSRVPGEALDLLGEPERVYRDAFFSVYRLRR
jgi:hypothetical protein